GRRGDELRRRPPVHVLPAGVRRPDRRRHRRRERTVTAHYMSALEPSTTVDAPALRAPVVNENEARAAAGLTMALGAVAFAYANFGKVFWPIKLVSAFFFVDFLLRVTVGLERSFTGLVAGWLTRRQPPQWVSAKPKRFAWTLGLFMALAMSIITGSGIHGPL